MKKITIVLISILILATTLRLAFLGSIPAGIFCDEAANGYNTYTIMHTGRDLQGNLFPFLINHHDIDYVEPLYTYLSAPFIAFGLNTLTTRMLAAIVGVLTVFATFLFTNEWFDKRTALIAAFLVAISPWHLVFSRIAFRGILLPVCILLGLYFLKKGEKDARYIIVAALVFGLSLYTYGVIKAVLPLIIIAFVLLYRKTCLRMWNKEKKHVIRAALVLLLLSIPIIATTLFGKGNMRFSYLSVFTAQQPLLAFITNFLAHINPAFLFFEGDANIRHSIPGFGQVLLILIPFILIAITNAYYKRKKDVGFLVLLFLIGIVPAALINEGVPHALRSIGSIPFLEIIAAIGMTITFAWLSKRDWKTIGTIIIIAAVAINAAVFVGSYFVTYPAVSEEHFQYGMKEAIAYVEENEYDAVVLSSGINQAYIFPLFFANDDEKYSVCQEDIATCYDDEGRNAYIVLPDELPLLQEQHAIKGSSGKTILRIIG